VRGYGGILKIGRCTTVPKEGDGEDEAEEEGEVEEEVPPLGGITEDPPVATFGEEEGAPPELPAWTFRTAQAEIKAYSVGIAMSNRWPGAYAGIAKYGDKQACIYLGWGQEQKGKDFTLESFPPILAESVETNEAVEVTSADENTLLKEIDEAVLAAQNAEGDEGDE